ncbi:MAG: zinc ribbon domain-containing protein [Burkholderiaceae bacterium]|nr:zinc ribbon domain-containing protein [Microbacteriaceae bacterium]
MPRPPAPREASDIGPSAAVTRVELPAPPREEAAGVCGQCGADMPAHDIFCGECGHVSSAVSAAFASSRDTNVIVPVVPGGPMPSAPPTSAAGPVDPPLAFSGPVDPPATALPASALPATALPATALPAAALPAAALVAAPPRLPLPGFLETPVLDDAAPAPAPAPTPRDEHDFDDVEATRITSRGGSERFVLQFSTGETVTISGSGLIGRNPTAEPSEHFDHLVKVHDRTRSVSKTHLEFGQQSGVMWVRDRHSGNGSFVREPHHEPYRCDAGKRYTIVRGTRIDLGEQFLIVS